MQILSSVMQKLSSEVLGALITLLGVLITACITLLVAKNKRVVEIVTKNRAEWVTELKKLFSEYLNYTRFYLTKSVPEDISKYIDDLNLISKKISIQLNPIGEKDNDIINLINNLNNMYEKFFLCHKITEKKKEIGEVSKEEFNKKFFDNSVKSYIDSYLNIAKYIRCVIEKNNVQEDTELYYIYAFDLIAKDSILAFFLSETLQKVLEIKIKIYFKCEWERIKFESKHSKRKYKFNKQFNKFENEEIIKNKMREIENAMSEIFNLYDIKAIIDEDETDEIIEINKNIVRGICFH